MSKFLFIISLFICLKAEAQSSALAVSDSLYIVGNYSAAIKILKEISPATEAVNLHLAKIYNAQGDLDEAEKYYENVLTENPNRILSALELGKLLIRQPKLEKADSLFRGLAERYPENTEFHYQLGVVLEKLEDSTALDRFRKVIQLDQSHQNALYKLAKNELQNKQYQLAVDYSIMGLERNPGNVSLLSILAQSYYLQQEYKKAANEFEKIVKLGQGNEFVYSRLGFSYFRLSDFIKAIDNYKMALNFEDRNSDTHYNLGKLYAINGDLKNSEIHLLMAILIKKQPVDSEFLSLGLTYSLQEDYKKALEYFNKSLEENPGNERALYERAIAGDNFFKDLQTKINYYQQYINKYSGKGNQDMLYLAETRMRDLKKELHLKE